MSERKIYTMKGDKLHLTEQVVQDRFLRPIISDDFEKDVVDAHLVRCNECAQMPAKLIKDY